jgi:hypothetical protein
MNSTQNYWKNHKKDNEEVKEPFCGACVAGIAALAGTGAAGGSSKIENPKNKDIVFWVSVTITVVSIAYLIYLLCLSKKGCDECK